jgi:hypothetical protein
MSDLEVAAGVCLGILIGAVMWVMLAAALWH